MFQEKMSIVVIFCFSTFITLNKTSHMASFTSNAITYIILFNILDTLFINNIIHLNKHLLKQL